MLPSMQPLSEMHQKRYAEIPSQMAHVKALPVSGSARHNQKELALPVVSQRMTPDLYREVPGGMQPERRSDLAAGNFR